jgi:hypothetical protein
VTATARLDADAIVAHVDEARVEMSTSVHVCGVDAVHVAGGARREHTLLAIEYAMPVPASYGERALGGAEPLAWVRMPASAVAHVLAVAAGDATVTLWGARAFDFRGVLHSIAPQDVLAWASGVRVGVGV